MAHPASATGPSGTGGTKPPVVFPSPRSPHTPPAGHANPSSSILQSTLTESYHQPHPLSDTSPPATREKPTATASKVTPFDVVVEKKDNDSAVSHSPINSSSHLSVSLPDLPPSQSPAKEQENIQVKTKQLGFANDYYNRPREFSVGTKIKRIFQRFLVRCPHAFIAMTVVFVPLYYGMNKVSLAYSATTFVGVGGTVYCLTRALFLEIIPEWMLPRTNETRIWRHLISATYTGFITVMFTSAVWKLPDIDAFQGLIFLGVTFGLPYPWLSKFYPDIDKNPIWPQG